MEYGRTAHIVSWTADKLVMIAANVYKVHGYHGTCGVYSQYNGTLTLILPCGIINGPIMSLGHFKKVLKGVLKCMILIGRNFLCFISAVK